MHSVQQVQDFGDGVVVVVHGVQHSVYRVSHLFCVSGSPAFSAGIS
jgi:hypothetical protein